MFWATIELDSENVFANVTDFTIKNRWQNVKYDDVKMCLPMLMQKFSKKSQFIFQGLAFIYLLLMLQLSMHY